MSSLTFDLYNKRNARLNFKEESRYLAVEGRKKNQTTYQNEVFSESVKGESFHH